MKGLDQSCGSVFCSLHYGPVRVMVDNYEVSVALVVKVVCTYALEWIFW